MIIRLFLSRWWIVDLLGLLNQSLLVKLLLGKPLTYIEGPKYFEYKLDGPLKISSKFNLWVGRYISLRVRIRKDLTIKGENEKVQM